MNQPHAVKLKNLVKRKNSFLILLLLVNLAAFAQQEPLFSTYMLNRASLNPAFSGVGTEINASFVNRIMFAGLSEGKPVTSVFSVEGPVEILGLKSGLGVTVRSDEIGFQQQTDVEFNYAYHRNTEVGRFGLGLNLGFYNYSINGEWVIPSQTGGNYKMVQPTTDPYIPGNMSNMAFGIGLGTYYQSTNYYLGLSANKINSAEIRNDTGGGEEEGKVFYFYRPNLYLTGGYNIALPDPLFDLRPTFMLRTDLAAYQLDMNGSVYYKDKHWAGLGLRSSFVSFDAVTFMFGTELINGLNIGYALDINTSAMFLNGATSHEFFVSYSFNLKTKKEQKYKSVRYL